MRNTFRRRLVSVLTAAVTMATATFVVGVSPASAEDAMCYTTTNSSSWYAGPSASKVYDARTSYSSSVAIPSGLISDRYVPQGMAALSNWNGTSEDILLISAYLNNDDDKAEDGRSAIFGVVASGSRRGLGLGRMLISQGHVGGLAVYKGFVYVGSEKQIRAYSIGQVRSALKGPNSNATYYPKSVYSASYTVGFMGTGDGFLWAGRFSETEHTKANRYVQANSSTGALRYTRVQYVAPKKTQGVAVTSNRMIFSTSFGRNNRSNIWVMPHGRSTLTDGNSYCFRAPSMTEGITILNGRLWISYESGAWWYNKGWDDPRNPIDRIHSMALVNVTSLYGYAD